MRPAEMASESNLNDVVDDVRKVLELHLNADLSRLHAEDDFSKNLKFFFDRESMVDVEM